MEGLVGRMGLYDILTFASWVLDSCYRRCFFLCMRYPWEGNDRHCKTIFNTISPFVFLTSIASDGCDDLNYSRSSDEDVLGLTLEFLLGKFQGYRVAQTWRQGRIYIHTVLIGR